MVKFYSDYLKHWCLGANVKESIKCAMFFKMNGFMPCCVYDETTVEKINSNSGKNFNLIITDYEEKKIDKLKPKIEQILKESEQIIEN